MNPIYRFLLSPGDGETVGSEFAIGEYLNGATAITNGYTIPVGRTGQSSYFYVRQSPFQFNTDAFNGQTIKLDVQVYISNFGQLNNFPDSLYMQRMKDGVILGNYPPTRSTYSDSGSGTSMYRTFHAEYDVEQSDIDNQYYYQFFVQMHNTNPVNSVVNVQVQSRTMKRTFAQLVKPNYKDDLAKEYELETNQRFYRAKLSGKLTFQNQDYDAINNEAFDTVFNFLIFKSDDLGLTWYRYFTGKFMKTDCEFDDDHKKVVVQPDVLDEYNDVLAGLEKEYNLIELAPRIDSCIITKRPLIQIYIPGDSVVSCFLGGVYWEQDAEAIDDRNALIRTYYFALCNLLKEINVTVNGTPADANGTYVGRMTPGANNTFTGTLYPERTNGYFIRASQVYSPPFFGVVIYDIVRSSDNVVVFHFQQTVPGGRPWDNETFTMQPQNGATGTATAEMTTYNIYARYLCDVENIGDLSTYPLPTEDIVENNRNYQRVIGYAIDVAFISNNYRTTPTQWGRVGQQQLYFAPPYSIWGQEFYPIARSTWRYASIWFGFYAFDYILEEQARKQYTLRDAYPIASCINVLLKQFAPGLRHEATTEYSQFLYGTYNPISYRQFRLLLTQKTNLLVGDYDQPAQKAPVTLQQLTNMLRDCFRCFWYVEDGKFKVEHIQWFRNGGSYNSSPNISVDLTQLTVPSNLKKWGYLTSKYSFDKVDMPERYQFEWMDDVTKGFEGFPIEVLSKYVTAGKIETVNVSNFTSDVDYMLLNPGAISNDGFALLAAKTNANGVYELPIERYTVQNIEYILQNPDLSMLTLQPSYYVYDLPARRVKINGSEEYAYGIERKKKQTLNFPALNDPNPLALIKTYLGNAQVDKLSINLHSRGIKATLKYDTE